MAKDSKKGKPASSKKNKRWGTIRTLSLTVFVVLLFRALVAEAYVIPSGSMEPGLMVGDRLFASKASYGLRVPFTDHWVWRWGAPRRGEVVLFSDPRGSGETLIKRVVAVGGDRIAVRDQRLLVNGESVARVALPDPCWMDLGGQPVPCRRYRESHGGHRYRVQQLLELKTPGLDEVTVPKGHFFAMGDNRDDSADSRVFGAVSYRRLRGRALFIFWSWGAEGEGLRTQRLGQPIHGPQ